MISAEPRIIEHPCPVMRIGHDGGHHFFGYYDKTNWDRSDRYLLANRVAMKDAELVPDLRAEVGFFDLRDDGRFRPCGETTAWNWQMGCQLQWLDGDAGLRFIYNVRTDTNRGPYPGLGSAIHDVKTGNTRSLHVPIYVAAPDGSYALTVDYARLYVTHKTIGYAGVGGERASLQRCPADDGILHVDLATGATRLAVSYADLSAFHHLPSMDAAIHWVSHIEINPASKRVLFLHRWTERVEDETCFLHRLITMDPDGRHMRLLECSDHPLPQLSASFDPNAAGTYDYEKSEYQISHPLWRDDKSLIAWSPHAGEIHYHLYEDSLPAHAVVVGRDALTENGHMTYSPTNKRWLISDTYPDPITNERILILYDTRDDIRYNIARLYTDPTLSKENRCDLHPRWRRDGQQVCIDSVHEGERQMYLVDLSSVVGPG